MRKLTLILLVIVLPIQAAAKKLTQKRKRNISSVKSTKSVKAKTSSFSGAYKFKVGSFNVEDTNSKANWANFQLSSNINYKISKTLKLKFAPIASFQAGNSQSVYSDLEAKNRVGIKEGFVKYDPFYFLTLNGGILSQKRLNNELLIRRSVSFPSISGNIHFVDYKKIKLNLDAQNAIVTSSNFDTEATSKEKTPTFNSISLNVDFNPNKLFNSFIQATKFSFNNLTSDVARKSRLYGNTVSDEYHFNNEYKGYSLYSKIELHPYKLLSLGLEANYLKNSEAEAGYNRAFQFSSKATAHLPKKIDVTGVIIKFRNEPDASPAYYNSIRFGNSNRQGYSYQAELIFNKYNLKLIAQHFDGHLIYKSLSQTRRKSYIFWLETLNVEF